MHARDTRDLAAGGLLVLLGLWIGFHSIANFDLGTLGRMGPGMFPASLGFLLAGLGVMITIPAFFRPGEFPEIHWRPFIFISLATLIFALTVTRFGMIPAVILTTIVTAFSDNKLGLIGTAILSVVLAVLAHLIFRVGLGIVLEPFRWPF